MAPHLVVMGSSLGGLQALKTLLPALPEDFSAALILVLHRGKEESSNLLPPLNSMCALPVAFPSDKEPILAGHVYVAPPNYHLLIEDDHFAYSMDEPEDFARPSINVLFESAAEAYGANVTGIVLTGLLRDGARGLAVIHGNGGEAVVQSPHDAVASSMPLAALAAVPSAHVLTLAEIGKLLAKMTY